MIQQYYSWGYSYQGYSFRDIPEGMLGYYKGTCTSMFIATLFTTAKLWK
jgi:hypothetical protein